MKILVVGSGGREHAICRALATASPPPEIIVAPGNPGTAGMADNVDVAASDIDGLVELARSLPVDLVIPGPEAPLVAGLADRLLDAGIPVCGPSGQAAKLEGSKRFTRELAREAGVPGARFEVVQTVAGLESAVDGWDGIPVVKADGLAAGKGVLLPVTRQACVDAGTELLEGKLGAAGLTVVLEERLDGVEASLFYACLGQTAVALPHARDHKRLHDGDLGPNTGGMGAISPNPFIEEHDEDIERLVRDTIITPTLATLERRGTPYSGFLFAGLMLTSEGPRLLEYNVRLGDPEAQAVLPRIADGEFLALCLAVGRGDLEGFELSIDPRPTCAIVLAADGYPDQPRQGDPIRIADDVHADDRWLDHAGTRKQNGALVTSGGRVAAVVARGASAATARAAAYAGVDMVSFDGMQFRHDIGDELADDTTVGDNP
ncbi:MAG: phosphoribosylamine--glycine ligase [Myxococcota bacterium]